ncbi:MAG: hypothetical protein IJM91_03975 [Lachnospiraceae bacterium]|nr:hypothetical protein [Lachnospiraceae bacterium]
MNVYLFELDSVRNSKEEIEVGQRAIFREIVLFGNSVILTYNQLTDSSAFFACLKDEESYEAMIKLCELGFVKVSLYKSQRTAAQYILQHLERMRGNDFVFSLLPLGKGDEEVFNDLSNALHYSDLRLLKEKALEFENREKYTLLYRYVKLILALSRHDNATLPENKGSYKTMMEYLDIAEKVFVEGEGEVKGKCRDGITLLREISKGEEVANLNRRSYWYKLIEKTADKRRVPAKAVIDLCYNFALEDSISNVEKSYVAGDSASFREAFEDEMKILLKYGTDVEKSTGHTGGSESLSKVRALNWPLAVSMISRNMDYLKGDYDSKILMGKQLSREEREKIQLKRWRAVTRKSLWHRFLIALIYAFFFGIVSYVVNWIQGFVTTGLEGGIDIAGKIVIEAISVLVFGIISSLLFRKFNLPDILETMESVRQGISEQLLVRRTRKEEKI